MKTVALWLYRIVVVGVCAFVVLVLLSSFAVNTAHLQYDLAKDTRTTWNRVVHPFTSDMEYVFQPGGGLDKLQGIASSLK